MLKKIIIHVLIISFLLAGCYSWETVQRPELYSELRITTKNNEQFELKTWQQVEEYIIGPANDNKGDKDSILQKIKITEIDKVEEKSFSVLKTTLFISGSAVVLAFAAYGMYYVGDKLNALMKKI